MLGNQGCDGPTAKLSLLVDKLLQTIAQLRQPVQQKSYMGNTKVPADVILVSMDVTSPQEEGIHTVSRAYETFYINGPPIPTQLLEQYPKRLSMC